MKLIKSGSSRYVFIIGNFAIKIPSFYNWKCFLKGLLANIQEVEFSKCKEYKNVLCPILFYIPFGLLLIMPKVRVLYNDELSTGTLFNFIIDNKLPVEPKFDSFGYLNNKLIAIDYG